jgi:hypothetical protein
MVAGLVITIIPNWNLRTDLGECLNSLQESTYADHRVIVVDNGSIDGSPEFVREQYPWVSLIALRENRGYAAALNVGIISALKQGAEYVFALNNDTVVEAETLARLVEILESDESIAIAAPKILYYDHPTTIYRLGDRIYPLLPLPLAFGQGWSDGPRFSDVTEYDYVTGCAMLIRASLFRDIGLFDTGFFMYYEDADFCRRARSRGHRIICVGDTVIYHKASLSANKIRHSIIRTRARNRVRFYRRYPHGPHPWLTYLALGLVAVWRSFSGLMSGQGALVRRYLLGLWEGWREPPPPVRYDGSGEFETTRD